MTGRAAALSWALTRMAVLAMLVTYAADAVTDVNYYRNSLDAMSAVGLAHTMVEYPLPAVAVVAIPWALAGVVGLPVYGLLLVALAAATDGLLMWALLRRSAGDSAGPLAWVLLVPALGAVTYVRFDLLPGVLVAMMLLLHRRRPVAAAVAVAVATCVKLWPVLLVPAVVAASGRRLRSLVAVGAVGAATVAGVVALSGWHRLVSPLGYQGKRGLQIEAVAATPAMVAHWWDPDLMRVWFAPSRSWEVTGPATSLLLTATTVLTVVLAVALVAAWSRSLAAGQVLAADALVWLTLTSVVGFIALGRVMSPQYLLWVTPAAAAGLVVARRTRPALVRWTWVLGAAAVLTNLLYPALYRPLLEPGPLSGLSVLVLAVRNALVLVLMAWAALMTWRCLASGKRSAVPADEKALADSVDGAVT